MQSMMNGKKMINVTSSYSFHGSLHGRGMNRHRLRAINFQMIKLLSKDYRQLFKKKINRLDYRIKSKFGRHIGIKLNKYCYLIIRLSLKIQLILVTQRLNKLRSAQKLKKRNPRLKLKQNLKERNLQVVSIYAFVARERITSMYLIHLPLREKLCALKKRHHPK